LSFDVFRHLFALFFLFLFGHFSVIHSGISP
jgi:hypothetical protein